MTGIRSKFFENIQQGYESVKHVFNFLGGMEIGSPHYKSSTGMVFGFRMQDGRAYRITLEYMPTLSEQQEYLQEQSENSVNPVRCKYCGQDMLSGFCNVEFPHPSNWENFSEKQEKLRHVTGTVILEGDEFATFTQEYLMSMKPTYKRRFEEDGL